MEKILEFLNKNTYAETIDENYVSSIKLHHGINEKECSEFLGCNVIKGQNITEMILDKLEKDKELKYYDSDLERNEVYDNSFYYVINYLEDDEIFEGFNN